MLLFFGIIAGIIAGVLIEYLFKQYLPEKPTVKHILAILGFVIMLVGFSLWSSSMEEIDQDIINANQISNCVEKHGLIGAQEKRVDTDNQTKLFFSCEWPAPSYADADGFSWIVVETVDGPEADHLEIGRDKLVAPMAARIKSNCNTLLIEPAAGQQNGYSHQDPIEVKTGNIVDPSGNFEVIDYRGYDLAQLARFDMMPEKNETIVFHSFGWLIENAQCVD